MVGIKKCVWIFYLNLLGLLANIDSNKIIQISDQTVTHGTMAVVFSTLVSKQGGPGFDSSLCFPYHQKTSGPSAAA